MFNCSTVKDLDVLGHFRGVLRALTEFVAEAAAASPPVGCTGLVKFDIPRSERYTSLS